MDSGGNKMIITGNGIALEREEINGISVTGSKVILPFDSMDRVLPKAERLVYDATNDRAVHIITGDKLKNKLFYPLMIKDMNGFKTVSYNQLSDTWDGKQVYGTNDEIAKLLSLLTNRAVVETGMPSGAGSSIIRNNMSNKIGGIEMNFMANIGKSYDIMCSGMEIEKIVKLSDMLYMVGYLISGLKTDWKGYSMFSITRIQIARLDKELLNGIKQDSNDLDKADRIMEELFGNILVELD